MDESIAWIKEAVVGLLQAELSWETEIENSLEKCGVNTKLTNDGKFSRNMICFNHVLTLKAPRKSASENVVSLCRLLYLLANFSN